MRVRRVRYIQRFRSQSVYKYKISSQLCATAGAGQRCLTCSVWDSSCWFNPDLLYRSWQQQALGHVLCFTPIYSCETVSTSLSQFGNGHSLEAPPVCSSEDVYHETIQVGTSQSACPTSQWTPFPAPVVSASGTLGELHF